jgi:hypothetical protein
MGLSRWRVLLAYTTFQGSSGLCDSNDLASPCHARKQPILAQCDKPVMGYDRQGHSLRLSRFLDRGPVLQFGGFGFDRCRYPAIRAALLAASRPKRLIGCSVASAATFGA